jgi:hypothetical protein
MKEEMKMESIIFNVEDNFELTDDGSILKNISEEFGVQLVA